MKPGPKPPDADSQTEHAAYGAAEDECGWFGNCRRLHVDAVNQKLLVGAAGDTGKAIENQANAVHRLVADEGQGGGAIGVSAATATGEVVAAVIGQRQEVTGESPVPRGRSMKEAGGPQ